MPVDVVLLNLHGAMVAQGYDDCEEDIICRVRDVVGPKAVIGVELDLHCHLSQSMIAPADIVITYKEYPHIDVNDRARELFYQAAATKLGRIRPTTALFDCQMIGLYPTSRQPLRGLVDAMMEAERRRDIGFESLSLPLEQALSKALTSNKTPVVVADQSDNADGGAPGDATFALQWLLHHQAKDVAVALFYDPEVIRIAKKAGRGAILPVRQGGKLGPSSSTPVDIEVTVLSIRQEYQHAFLQQSGEPW